MKIIFMGTNAFSLTVLQALHEAFEVVLVVSQPDRPVGRKQIMTPSKVSEYALEQGLPLHRPDQLSKSMDVVLQTECDFIVTASFGQYVPTKVLQHPKREAINIHASLLPRYRGASPIHQAIANGDEVTGLSFMKMVKEMDAGDVYHQVMCPIDPSWKTQDLFDALGNLAAQTIVPFLTSFQSYSPTPQDLNYVTFANKMSKDVGYLDFHHSAMKIHHQLRAFDEEPGCRVQINDTEIKVYTGLIGEPVTTKESIVTKLDESGLYISCCDNEYIIQELQVPGKKRQSIKEFIQGNHWIQPGDVVRTLG
jgi:methionyl-tRNA formyltransferase